MKDPTATPAPGATREAPAHARCCSCGPRHRFRSRGRGRCRFAGDGLCPDRRWRYERELDGTVRAIGGNLALQAAERCGKVEAAVFEHQRAKVLAVEELDANVGVELAQAPQLAVLPANERLL